MARFVPQPHHCAAPRHFVNGGIIATLIDCHSICTATAAAYLQAGRALDSEPPIFLVTASLTVSYQRPAPIDEPLLLIADVGAADGSTIAVRCTLQAGGRVCALGDVVAARVGESWMKANRR